MTLINKITTALVVAAMSMGLVFALGGQPIGAIVCETSDGSLVQHSGSACPDGQERTSKATICESQIALGNSNCLGTDRDGDGVPDVEQNVVSLGETIVDILSLIVGIVSVIVIIFSGFRFITSGGDAQQVASARSGIIYAIVGIVIVILAQAIVAFVINEV